MRATTQSEQRTTRRGSIAPDCAARFVTGRPILSPMTTTQAIDLSTYRTGELLVELDERGGRRASLPNRPGWFEIAVPGEARRLILEESSAVGRQALIFIRVAA